MRKLICFQLLLALLVTGAVGTDDSSTGNERSRRAAAISPQQIEADWLRRLEVRLRPPQPQKFIPRLHKNVTPAEDARGGVDGVKDGTWGFHTGLDDRPWWQVDLGGNMLLARVVIYNTGYQQEWKRAMRLTVLLSGDGKTWQEVYRHDGSKFRGPKQPLKVVVNGAKARYVRIQLPVTQHLTLEEIEVYQAGDKRNVALDKRTDQSSSSKWSTRGPVNPWARQSILTSSASYVTGTIERGLMLGQNLRALGADVDAQLTTLHDVSAALKELPAEAPANALRNLDFKAQWAVRRLALANPLLDFDKLLFVKRAPNRYVCHCDEYLSWWSRPGGQLCILEDFASDSPRLRSLTADLLPPGDIVRPDISYDGTKVLFAYCKHYPDLWQKPNKLDKSSIPEDAFYHLYEMNLDGTGLRRLTRGKYDDFDGRYLPSGDIVFLSTRRGQFIQCGRSSARSTNATEDLPDSFVRCGGDPYRPVSVHTLHAMDGDGGNMRCISPFESFEWNPSVAHDGRILYARWDYVDRHRMWHMGLWSTLPDGMAARAVFGNFTQGPYSVFEARSIPNSQKIIFTASGHHSHAGGSLVLLDTRLGVDGQAPMRRLTPEVCFPEWEGWPTSYYANPYPLSEDHYLVAWSGERLPKYTAKGRVPVAGPTNSLGVYLYDAFGNLTLLYRDATISSMYPLPIRARPRPTTVASQTADADFAQEGRMLLQDVYQGDLKAFERGSVRRLRIVGVPPKTNPVINKPVLGVNGDDPGKFVLGTVPVEEDGSAYFRLPAGLPVFFQALNAEGMALQTMRSLTYVQPGQTFGCIGCHEHRQTAPPNQPPLAARREPSKIRVGPEGSWPLDFQALVQPVLEKHCVRCHRPGAEGKGAKTNLARGRAYQTLMGFGGGRSLRTHVQARYNARRSVAGACGAMSNPLNPLLSKEHYDVRLTREDRRRLIVWMDTYGQVSGSHGVQQQRQLKELRAQLAGLLTQPR